MFKKATKVLKAEEQKGGLRKWIEGLLGKKEQEKKKQQEKKEQEKKDKKDSSSDDDDENGGIMMPITPGLAGLFYSRRFK